MTSLMIKIISFIATLIVSCNGFSLHYQTDPPPFYQKPETARWLAHEHVYGTLSTTSVHLNGQAWGTTKSYVDGSISNSTGDLYFYDCDINTSIQDIQKNPFCSFSVTMAESGRCDVNVLDPEDPRCTRATFSGKFVEITDQEELVFAKNALFERHPQMEGWPDDHTWRVYKIELSEIFLLDIYGGGMIYIILLNL